MDESNLRIKTLLEYLHDNPDDSFSQYALALEYDKLGKREKAIRLLEQLKTREPDYLACYYQLGKLYEADGKPENASETFKKGIEVATKQKNQKTLNELRSALDLMD